MRKLTLFFSLLLTILLVAQPTVSIQDQKMLVTDGESSYVLAPNGDDASYFWASVSPDGKHLVYVTAKYGTFVCDINGKNVRSMGRMNAPKWLDNSHISGMQEFYKGENIPALSPHELRHTRATIWVNEGKNLFAIAEQMGWSDLDMLRKRYGHADIQLLRKELGL